MKRDEAKETESPKSGCIHETIKRSSKKKRNSKKSYSSSRRKRHRKSSVQSDDEDSASSDSSIDSDKGDRNSDTLTDSGEPSVSEDSRQKESKLRRRKRRHHSSSESLSSETDSYASEHEKEEKRRRRHRHRSREIEHGRRERHRDKKERSHRHSDHVEDEKKAKRKKKSKKEKKKKNLKGKVGPVTDSWGKYGIIKEIDMWSKRPEFSAWLAEVKKVNLETMPAWEEKQMFKEYMEDFNTATLAKKYYDLDAYHRRQMIKEARKGISMQPSERTEFNDEEQRRQEIRRERELRKEAELEALKHSMRSGMAQAMKEQAQLREEMQYQYRLGNFEAANAIQRRLDPAASGAPLK
ncbi:hypothetical protein KP509_34G049500 [Ceratopteris richardii]|uniref:Uncharacterized protein n=1 Tax=Ceratopteris richardii TaxID=49495 RepID=A0A8T2QKJ6_CERRI|nr:hypothetical protein KP509_34G049500 [Ceratopteris richardii]